MVAIAIAENNTRVEDSDAIAGWSSIGGGAGASAEASFPYQGVNVVNRKVTSGTGAGFGYQPTTDAGTTHDMTTAAKRTMLAKIIVTDFGGLQPADGIRVRIGSGTGAYHVFVLAGSNSPVAALGAYPARGGYIVIPVDPNIAGYRDSTTGSPALGAVDWFGLVAAFATASAKSENVGLDAIDLGTGLTMTGGDGADADGVLQDFIAADQDIVNNRWGYAFEFSDGVLGAYGTWTVGGAAATVMTDISRKSVIFPDGMFAAGWSGMAFDLQNAGTAISLRNKNLTGLGTTTTEDTRPVITVSGTAGTCNLSDNIFLNFAAITLTSAVTIDGASVLNSEGLVHGGATISNTLFSGSPVASGTAMMTVAAGLSSITDCTFVSGGTGHAIEITATGTYNWSGNSDSGYGADLSNDAVIYNNSGGLVTINVINGATTPTYRNGAGATTTIVSGTVTIRVEVIDLATSLPIQNARVRVKKVVGGAVVLEGLTDANGIIEDTGYTYTSDEAITGWARKSTSAPYYQEGPVSGTITATGFSATVPMVSDE